MSRGLNIHTWIGIFARPIVWLPFYLGFAMFYFGSISVAIAQESIQVRGGLHDGFGRMVFDWPAPVKYSASIEGRDLVVRFGQQFSGDYGKTLTQLSKYIGTVKQSDDGHGAIFGLKQDLTLKTFTNRNSVVLDLHVAENGASRKRHAGAQIAEAKVDAAQSKKRKQTHREKPAVAPTPGKPPSGEKAKHKNKKSDPAADVGASGEQVASATPSPLGSITKVDESVTEVVETRDPNDLLILEIRLGQFILSEGTGGFINNGSLILPLGELARLLDFKISVDPAGERAGGWFMSENRLFSLDVAAGQVIIEGLNKSFNPGFIDVQEDDIYVDVRMLAVWFPIDIKFDLANLSVELTSREPLPIEQRIARNEYRTKALSRTDRKTNYRKVEPPHKAINWPFVDTSLDFAFRSEEGELLNKNARFNTFISGDLAWMDAQLFLSGDERNSLSQARFLLARRNLDRRLLGPLRLSEIEVGDIYTQQVSLVSKTQIGRGVLLSNVPINRVNEFDRITLNGDLPIGWEVELYRNEILLDFRVSRADSRYLFEDVPLLFGVNVLRLVFYGPQGQNREEVRQIRVGPDQIKPGQHSYRISANQQDRQLLLGDVDVVGNKDLQGQGRLIAEYMGGITKNFSVAANFSHIPFADGHRRYLGVSGRTAIGNIFGRVDVVRDLDTGWAGKLAAQTSIAGVTVIAEHNQLFSEFVSEQFNNTAALVKSTSNLRFDGVIRLPFLPHVPFSLNGDHEKRRSGDQLTRVTNRLSTAVGRANISNTLNWIISESNENETSTISGSFLTSGRVGEVNLRGLLAYAVTPLSAFTNSALTADWRISEQYNASLGYNADLRDEGITTINAGVNARFEVANLGFVVDYSDNKEFSGRLTMSFSLGRDPRSGNPTLRSARLAEWGAVSARVFLDNNQNNVFDKGDMPIKGARFRSNGTELRTQTGEDGTAYITGLATYQPLDIGISDGSLENPFWIPQPEGVTVTLRPGVTATLDFPVTTTGEIDGTVYRQKGKWAGEVSDVEIQLVDLNGRIVKQVKSQFDGFYLFDYILPGEYVVRVDPDQMQRLDLQAPPERDVKIEGDGSVINGLDFVINGARTTGKLRLRLTSFLTEEAARKAWVFIVEALPETSKRLVSEIEGEQRPDGSTVFGLHVGPFETRAATIELCKKVRQIKGSTWCNPIRIETR